jgi:hypothetical protein
MKIYPLNFDHLKIDVSKALLWRHENAKNLKALITKRNEALKILNIDFWSDWFENVFNLDTANDFGLLVWAIILDVPLTIDNNSAPTPNNNWGFGTFRKNFENGNFTPLNDMISLNSEDARKILKLKYYQMITRATVPECNKILNYVFPDLTPYVVDNLDMTMDYIFNGSPSSSMKAAFTRLDILPRPSAVELTSITYL